MRPDKAHPTSIARRTSDTTVTCEWGTGGYIQHSKTITFGQQEQQQHCEKGTMNSIVVMTKSLIPGSRRCLDRKSPKLLSNVVLKLSIACMTLAVAAGRRELAAVRLSTVATFAQLQCQTRTPFAFLPRSAQSPRCAAFFRAVSLSQFTATRSCLSDTPIATHDILATSSRKSP
jgi:hypothetical protein